MEQSVKAQGARILIAGTGSGCGKTTITCGLLKCFQDMGKKVHAFKCGPDYIDAMYHSRVLGVQTGNLDSWFTQPDTLKWLLKENSAHSDISVIEGVMGYYDGAGFTDQGSAYEIAAMTGTPTLLVVNCRGISTSIGALLRGFTAFRTDSHIRGVLFNQLPERLYPQAKAAAEELGLVSVGYLSYQKEAGLDSRHLGLVTAQEVTHFEEKIEQLAENMKKTVDLDSILKIAQTEISDITVKNAVGQASENIVKQAAHSTGQQILRIAAARDAAFCFLYQDNLDYLSRHGCEIVYFSPIKDQCVPDNVQGLLLCGGYPENYAKQLSENVSMRMDIAKKIAGGIPCIAECGGFLYLHEQLEAADGTVYPMAGVIAGRGEKMTHIGRFGYMTLTAQKDTLLAAKGEQLKAHEFHYWNSTSAGTDYAVEKASDGSVKMGAYGSKSLYAGFPHFYFYGNEQAAQRFLDACRQYAGADGMALSAWAATEALDKDAMQAAEVHWNQIAKPLHGLGRLEDLIVQIAGIQRTPKVDIHKRAVIVMCADNGIVEEGVTQTDQTVTALVSCNMAKGIASVCKMSAAAGADVIPVDIGIAADRLPDGGQVAQQPGLVHQKIMPGTKNFIREPAMNEQQVKAAIKVGMDQAAACVKAGYKILATGEMGIGNTTTSAALTAILLNLPAQQVTGRGAGLDDSKLERKRQVVQKACELYGKYRFQPLKLIQCIGGLDIAGLTGVFLGAARYRVPVIVDGVISAVAALLAVRLNPDVKQFILISHQGKEPAMNALLAELGGEAVISAQLALGEGTGAVMLFPLLDMAMQIYDSNTTFDDLHMAAYEKYQ